jgi:hypothetical protein
MTLFTEPSIVGEDYFRADRDTSLNIMAKWSMIG